MILSQELSTLDSEIASLQALIESKRQQQELLTSAESLAAEALARLTQALYRIEEVAPSAIASLKTAVLGLFGDGNDDSGGNEPTEPTPDDPSSLEGQECDIDKAPLLGQHCSVSFEDNENKSTSEGGKVPYVDLIKYSDAIAYQRKIDGEIICVYLGFQKKGIAQSWLHFFEVLSCKIELRQAKRMEGFKWEIKIKGVGMPQLRRFALEDLSKKYNPGVASKAFDQRITCGGVEMVISSTPAADGSFFCHDDEERRYKLVFGDVNEFIEAEPDATETPAQQAGIDAPSDWRNPSACILEVGDVVEIESYRHPAHHGLVGTITEILALAELPIQVKSPRGLKGYQRNDLKLISKGEKPQQQQSEEGRC